MKIEQAGFFTLLLGAEQQCERAHARSCAVSWSTVDQLLVNTLPTPDLTRSCGSPRCGGLLLAPNSGADAIEKRTHELWIGGTGGCPVMLSLARILARSKDLIDYVSLLNAVDLQMRTCPKVVSLSVTK